MRYAPIAVLIVLGLAACGEADPPKPAAAPEPPKPVVLSPQPVQAAAQSAPPAVPAPSAEALLLDRVKKALRDTRKVDGQGVGVTVAGTTVNLYGTAPSDDERRRIERFVSGIDGVKAVVSKLVVVRGS